MSKHPPMELPTDIRDESVAERQERGRAARQFRSRASLADWQPPPGRRDPVEVLLEQEASRVAELLAIRHTRMAQTPFTFYRGAAALMAADLGGQPSTQLTAQGCGDAHLLNFGLFASPDRSMIFDVNDFDETHPAPFEWDVARLVVSFELAAQDNGFGEDDRELIRRTAAQAYRLAMLRYASMGDLEVWYDRVSAESMLDLAREQAGKVAEKSVTKVLDKARSRDRWSAVSKLTTTVDGQRQFLEQPPLLTRVHVQGPAWDRVHEMMHAYRGVLLNDRRELLRRYRIVDIGHKVVGVGSVGLLAFVVLLQGRDETDLLVLQVKQAVNSVLEPYTKESAYRQQGERVVAGQRLMQAASDVFLGWVTGAAGRDYYIRQLRDMKWSPDIARLTPAGLVGHAELCGWTLARGHARSGDAVAIAGYLGNGAKFDLAMSDFAARYALQSNADYAAFTTAIRDGAVNIDDDEQSPSSLRQIVLDGQRVGPRVVTETG